MRPDRSTGSALRHPFLAILQAAAEPAVPCAHAVLRKLLQAGRLSGLPGT